MQKLASILAITAVLVGTGVPLASASPLKNLEPGKVAIDLGYSSPTSVNFTDHNNDGKKGTVYGGVTVGVAHKTGVNYKYNEFKSNSSNKAIVQQLNLIYNVAPHVNVYGGLVNAKTTVSDDSHTNNSGQIGLQGSFDIPLFCTVYGSVGVGNKMNSWEIGLSKALVNNLDLNLSYSDYRLKDINQGGDLKTRGINVGLTLKF